jgi:ABC-type transport system involved in multi-copper enzyme maturation permease subunit
MNEGLWFSIVLIGTCMVLSIPGLIIALKKHAWYGISVNSTIFVFFGIVAVWVPLFQNVVDYGQILPDVTDIHDSRYNLIGVIFLGPYWMIFQVITIPLAALIRRRRV